MFNLIGSCIGFWCLYAVVALIAGHKKSLIIVGILGCIAGISSLASGGNAFTLLGSIVGICLVAFIVPLQVKSKQKEKRQQYKQDDCTCDNCTDEGSSPEVHEDIDNIGD